MQKYLVPVRVIEGAKGRRAGCFRREAILEMAEVSGTYPVPIGLETQTTASME